MAFEFRYLTTEEVAATYTALLKQLEQQAFTVYCRGVIGKAGGGADEATLRQQMTLLEADGDAREEGG